jgi:hypothetical protein
MELFFCDNDNMAKVSIMIASQPSLSWWLTLEEEEERLRESFQ